MGDSKATVTDIGLATLQTVKKYREIAEDSQKRTILINDAVCVSFLVYVLDDQDQRTVRASLETLTMLSENQRHRNAVRSTYGIFMALESVYESNSADKDLQEMARCLHHLLKESKDLSVLKDKQNTSQQDRSFHNIKAGNHGKKIRNTFLYGINKAKTVVLQIWGMQTEELKKLCEKHLLTVKGVISLTFDSNKKRAILRVRPEIKPETLVMAVSSTDMMYAQQVLKNDKGEEVLINFGANCGGGSGSDGGLDKENSAVLPEYLPEEDSPVKEFALKKKGDREEQSAGWLSTAANFLSQSFYW